MQLQNQRSVVEETIEFKKEFWGWRKEFQKFSKNSPRRDSNPRPQAYEACAITTMLHGRK